MLITKFLISNLFCLQAQQDKTLKSLVDSWCVIKYAKSLFIFQDVLSLEAQEGAHLDEILFLYK